MASTADESDYRWLVTEPAGRLLAELASQDNDSLRAASNLRRHVSAARVHLLLEQIALRRRAREKFASPERLFFTRVALEQATDEWIATHKAGRFRQLGRPVCDLCCGIGGDLLALAEQSPVVGIDRNPITALLAQANLRAAERRQAAVVVADAAHAPVVGVAWHIDPDRRALGRRTTRVEQYEPGLPTIERLLRDSDAAAVKLAPAAELPNRWSEAAELEWISRRGESKQLVAWFGMLAHAPGQRRATIVLDDHLPPWTRTLVGVPNAELPSAEEVGRYLAEPDSAVLAAGLIGTLAAEHGLRAIAPGAVYLTGDSARADPALDWFEVSEALPFDLKRLKALLRQRRIGRLEIKQRGTTTDLQKLARQLHVPGSESATLVLARRGERVTALVTQRVRT